MSFKFRPSLSLSDQVLTIVSTALSLIIIINMIAKKSNFVVKVLIIAICKINLLFENEANRVAKGSAR